MTAVLRWWASAALLAAGGCGAGAGGAPERAAEPELRFVHLRWPGRPVSVRMDREVFARPGVRALADRIDLEVHTVDAAPAAVREVLAGFGTVALTAGGEPLGVLPGAVSAGAWRTFIARVQRTGVELAALRHRPLDAAGWHRRATLALGLGLVDEAHDALPQATPDLDLALRVHAARGDVAAMRAALDSAAADAVTFAHEVRVLLAGRRPGAALQRLAAVPADARDARWRLLRARALAGRGELRAAAALASRLLDEAAAPDAVRDSARALLARVWFDAGAAAHHHPAAEPGVRSR